MDGKPYAQTVDSLLAEQVLLPPGVHILVQWVLGCSAIGPARDRLVKKFLSVKEADCLVMVDADMSWEPGELYKLARHPHDVIGGTYQPKDGSGRYHVDTCEGPPIKKGDLWRVSGLPGGFVKISRAALEKMKPSTPVYSGQGGEEWHNYFRVGWLDGRYYQEDYGFCWWWRHHGGEVWLDPTLDLRHHDGIFREFHGDAAKWMDDKWNS